MFSEDDMTTHAAALFYQAFFSLFPFVLFFVALLRLLRLHERFDALLSSGRGSCCPGRPRRPWNRGSNRSRTRWGGLLSFGIVFTLWSASAAVRMAMQALNVAYNVEEERPVWRRCLLSILYRALVAVLTAPHRGSCS